MRGRNMCRNLFMALALIGFVPAVASCASGPDQESTGQYLDSSVISNKVRAQIIKDDKLSIFDIDVTTYKNVVQLSGFVSSLELKLRAGRIAAGVKGVRDVRNNIEIKPKG